MNFKIFTCLLIIIAITIPISFASENINEMSYEIADTNNISISDNNMDDLNADSHVYFNSEASLDGTGSETNPYKTLNGRLSSSYTHYHFAPGIYTINSKPYSLSSLTFIGKNPENTIIQFTGSGNFFSGVSLNFTGITLKNINIVSSSITASNTIFDSAKADVELETSSQYDYGNSYGGAIKISKGSSGSFWDDFWSQWGGTSYTSSIAKFDNCVFKNNYAAYGGAFYIDGASVSITNSSFESNHAPNGGGTIAAVNKANLTLVNCNFDNDYSSYDGGIVYLFNNSQAIIKNSNFNNCSAGLGGAITSINSQTTVISSNFTRNRVLYAGGAIYAMYGTLIVENSNFDSNYAVIGGAIYADGLDSLKINNGNFLNNEALKVGGAIVSCANNNSTIKNVLYSNNKADKNNNLYESSFLDVLIGGENYEMMNYTDDYNGVLPSKYDLRDYGYVTPLENQNNSGNCWAYATIAALESCILKASGKTYDLSEGNLKNIVQRYSNYGWTYETNGGGFYEMVMGYLTGWLGPVNATSDPSDDWDVLSPVLDSVVHIQNILFLQRSSYTDNNKIKEAIMKYGAVATEIYMDFSGTYYNSGTYGYYVNTNQTRNHAICVVGWDDTYSKNNFKSTPPGNGAWIVKNSYGTRWANNGYGYVSYYDTTLFSLKLNQLNAFTFIFNDTQCFNKNYQYDFGYTDYFIDGHDTIWCKNVYTSQGNDNIAAFSTFFNNTCDWQAYVYVNGDLKHTQTGTGHAGYYTFNFNNLIPVKTGDKFEIALKIHRHDGYASFAISEKTEYGLSHEHHTYGNSFYSNDGINWTDLYNYKFNASEFGHLYYSQAACLKVFTTANTGELMNTIVEILSYNSTGISAIVKTENGAVLSTGQVNFTVDGKSYSVVIEGEKAKLDVYLNQGNHVITINYLKNSLYNSSSITQNITISKEDLNIQVNASNINYGEILKIKVTLTNIAGENIIIPMDLKLNQTYCDVKNNEVSLSNLNAGEYIITVNVNQTDRYNSKSYHKSIKVLKVSPNLSVVSSDIVEGETASIIVNMPLQITDDIILNINDQNYTQSPVNGKVNFTLHDLSVGIYQYGIYFKGNLNYLSQIIKRNITVNEKLKNNITLNVSSKDIIEGETAGIAVKISENITGNLSLQINNKVFTLKPINSQAIFNISNLTKGIYNYTILFKGDENYNSIMFNGYINVFDRNKRIISIIVTDLTKYYHSEDKLIVTVLDNDFKAISNLTLNIMVGNDVYIKSTDDYGKCYVDINQDVGLYNVLVSFSGNNMYMKSNSLAKVNVLSTIYASNITRAYLSGKDFEAKFFNSDGDVLNNKTVIFTVEGRQYLLLTNSYGVARLNANLTVGNHIINIFNPLTDENINLTSKIVKRIDENRDLSMMYMDGSVYSVRVYGDNGNAVGFGETVKFKINNQIFNVKTDSDGYAILSLPLKSGVYTISAEYKDSTVSNKITVKSVYILTAKNISKKKAKKIKFSATLKKSDGKYVAGKKITFKIKGKSYKAVTNKKGIASFVLKKYKVGKYIVYSSFLKIKIKNIIKIKK